MHGLWAISDIVELVVAELSPVPSAGAADLAALARTCTLLHDNAIDALWAHQDTIMNLIHCMPADLWVFNDEERGVRRTRPIVPSDWDRLLKYAARVKYLYYVEQYNAPNLLEVFESLRLAFSEVLLLPNIRQLVWHCNSSAHISFMDLFLGPQISSIDIDHCVSLHEPNFQYRLLPNLGEKYPGLSAVTIAEEMNHHTADPQLCSFVAALTQVQVLKVGMLNLAALTHIGRLPTIFTLGAKIPRALSFGPGTARSLFSNLCEVTLEIDNGDIAALTNFVHTWKSPALESFDVDFNGTVPPVAVEELYQILSTHCVPEQLTTFKFDISWEEEDFNGTFIYPGRFLRSLFCFKNLSVVRISVHIGFELDDAVISELARTWPFLEELRLKTIIHDHPPRNTLLGLLAFAEHCPRLHTIEMTFDATTVPPLPIHGSYKPVSPLSAQRSPTSQLRSLWRVSSPLYSEA
ncbi:hypothetical protein C8R43DRAFT_1123505 [Mycena crocata]|nr:hypothetical protein C8R43DRAFT_1123505 [Mycena crocata]